MCSMPKLTDLTAAGGVLMNGQSFNETRALEVTPVGADAIVSQLILDGLNVPNGGKVGARIYAVSSQSLIASGDVNVGSGANQQVIVNVAATLAAGKSYMVGFFVEAAQTASATLFLPSSLPYSSGAFNVSAIRELAADGYPVNVNQGAPKVTIQSCGP